METVKAAERTEGRCPTLEIARALAEEPLSFEPGENYQYSLSLDVVGALVEAVSGQRFSDYCREHIFLPVGMEDTTFGITEDRLPRLATHYQFHERNKCAIEIGQLDQPYIFGSSYDSGGAGIVSTVGDQLLLAETLTHRGKAPNGNRILSSYAVDMMRENRLTPEQIATFSEAPHLSGYGYGYGVRTLLGPGDAGNIMPRGAFGWDGAKLCIFSACPESGVSFFHAEHMGGLHRVLIPRLRNIIYSCLDD